jgi:hypothetical protein
LDNSLREVSQGENSLIFTSIIAGSEHSKALVVDTNRNRHGVLKEHVVQDPAGFSSMKELRPIWESLTTDAGMMIKGNQTSTSLGELGKEQTGGFMIPEASMGNLPQPAITTRSNILEGMGRGELDNFYLRRCTHDTLEFEKETEMDEMDNMSMGDNDRCEEMGGQEDWLLGEQMKKTYRKKTCLQATRHSSRLRAQGA